MHSLTHAHMHAFTDSLTLSLPRCLSLPHSLPHSPSPPLTLGEDEPREEEEHDHGEGSEGVGHHLGSSEGPDDSEQRDGGLVEKEEDEDLGKEPAGGGENEGHADS